MIWLYYEAKSTLLGSRVRLVDGQASGIWENLPSKFGRSVTERVFERRVSKEGRRIRGLDEQPKPADAKPVTIRGSGGTKALGMEDVGAHSPASNAGSVQPAGFLSQLFVPGSGRSSSPNRTAEIDRQKQLDRIEEMLSQLLTGGMKVDNDDR